jgi:hypothetical protein
VNVSSLLEDDRVGAGVHRLHVEVGKLRHLRELFALRLVFPDVLHAIAIRNKEH